MNRIAELLSEVTMLQRKKQELHEVNTQLEKVILEWQSICSHPMEYLDEQEDGTILELDGDLSNLGNQGVSGMYRGTIDGTEMQGFLMALMPPSRGRAFTMTMFSRLTKTTCKPAVTSTSAVSISRLIFWNSPGTNPSP